MTAWVGLLALLPLVAEPAAPPPSTPQQNFVLRCQGCHGPDGRGVAGRVPALADTLSPLMQIASGRDFLLRVPGAANSALSDAALADVVNWLVARYASQPAAPDARAFTAADVTAARARPLTNLRETRRKIASELAARGIVLADSY
jgi:mono/diheme cytochrome c family protein